MEDYREFVGNTLEEAKEKARDYFNCNHIEYELMPPKFLTVITGKRDIRIKAKKKEFTPEHAETRQKIKQLLESIIKESGFSLSVSETVEDEAVRYVLAGEDVNVFTDSKGRLLDSLQHIVIKATVRGDLGMNIIVDAGDFKKEREDFIKSYVNKISSTVRRSNRPYITKPMNPAERRMVHMLVQAEGDLKSESQGEGLYKKIKISRVTNNGNGSSQEG